MTRFGYLLDILSREREVVWDKKSETLVIHDVSYLDARELLDFLQKMGQMKAAMSALQDVAKQAETTGEDMTRTVRPAPYRGDPAETIPAAMRQAMEEATRPKPVPPKPKKPRVVAEPISPMEAAKPTPPAPVPEEPAEDTALKAAIAASEPPTIPDEAKAKLAELANEANEAAEAAEAEAPPRQGMDPKKVLDFYREKENAKPGKEVEFKRGGEYKGHTIIQAGIEETHHGEMWVLLLDNEDQAMISQKGQEVEYFVAHVPEDQTANGLIDESQESAEEPPPASAVLSPPDDVLASRKLAKLLQWVVANDPAHQPAVDTARLVAQLWSLKDRATALKAAKTEDKVQRRVVGILTTLGMEVKG